jgi:hypothetical protein
MIQMINLPFLWLMLKAKLASIYVSLSDSFPGSTHQERERERVFSGSDTLSLSLSKLSRVLMLLPPQYFFSCPDDDDDDLASYLGTSSSLLDSLKHASSMIVLED